ncbi:hypothetical protein ACHHYP_08540 [Achlya hypogyna]|uniref:MYND-type domain-containing protein n=1 Tax=Achlya hypogyna TaxID=1202772 RepID=A0A1V9YPC6_ACHHY|nr:hypothetical protein ACHHYP_08540 [Achlya hypogyna]
MVGELNATLPGGAAVRCESHPVFGTSLVATRDIAIGDVVWAEEATLLRPGSSLLDYVKLLRDEPELAVKLAPFMTLTPEAIDADPIFAPIKSCVDALRKADRALVSKLVSAFELNGHGLTGDVAGLFPIASKAAHSCNPNVVYQPVGPRGMQYVAIKPIASGSLVFYSYIAREKLGYPSHVRQAFLQQAYYFTCGCTRCGAPDDMRPLPCAQCKTHPMLYDPATTHWTCATCGAVTPEEAIRDAVDLEEAIETQVLAFDLDPAAATADRVRAALAALRPLAAPGHWATIYLSRILVEMSLPPSSTYMAPPLSTAQVEVATKEIARWCRDVLGTYNPVSAAMLVFTYRTVLYPMSARDADVSALLRDLFPFFQLNFGPNDEDVVAWRALVLTPAIRERGLERCAKCRATGAGYAACGRCQCVAYCSKDCQVADWKTGGHKRACAALGSQRPLG